MNNKSWKSVLDARRAEDRAVTRNRSELAGVGAAFDSEFRRFEQLAAETRKLPLRNNDDLARATQATADVSSSAERVSNHLRALVQAMGAARERYTAIADANLARSREIQERQQVFKGLMLDFIALGEEGAVIVTTRNSLAPIAASPSSVVEITLPAEDLDGLPKRISDIVARARALVERASTSDVPEVVSMAEGLEREFVQISARLRALQTGEGAWVFAIRNRGLA